MALWNETTERTGSQRKDAAGGDQSPLGNPSLWRLCLPPGSDDANSTSTAII